MTENYAVEGLDATDLRVLDLLQRDASLSNQDLAAAAMTSPATCLRRVKRLVDAGVIERRV
ncbi:MAG TPA: Lrp/AsnC family transcriptional regulator, partial [Albitalea sp.]